ncbi:hypothetical protein [Mongoliitalea daihaiensis]|uniref:hypothetical protein n=1 Tax=Mongoliitalea daihaiensis TaxID=2782006 RepID=UPI001F271388|nr:hypothetical protein [Mongoliitalea daihaiensis]UJP64030.1 hypothetical protein IPZ59_14545 [Mongoliitalea daihaiensis]
MQNTAELKRFPEYRVGKNIPAGHMPYSAEIMVEAYGKRFVHYVEVSAGSRKSAGKKLTLIQYELRDYILSSRLEDLMKSNQFMVMDFEEISLDEMRLANKEEVHRRVIALKKSGLMWNRINLNFHHLAFPDLNIEFDWIVKSPSSEFYSRIEEIRLMIEREMNASLNRQKVEHTLKKANEQRSDN